MKVENNSVDGIIIWLDNGAEIIIPDETFKEIILKGLFKKED